MILRICTLYWVNARIFKLRLMQLLYKEIMMNSLMVQTTDADGGSRAMIMRRLKIFPQVHAPSLH